MSKVQELKLPHLTDANGDKQKQGEVTFSKNLKKAKENLDRPPSMTPPSMMVFNIDAINALTERAKIRQEVEERLGPYLEGKADLAGPEVSLEKDDIKKVDDHWLAPTGDVYKLWDDMLLVDTADGQMLIHPEISPEAYAVAKEALNSGELAGGREWASAGLSDEHTKWLGQRESEGMTVVKPGDEVPDLGELRYIGDEYLDMDAAVFFDNGFNLTVSEGGDGYYFESGTALFETPDGKRFAVSKEYAPEAFKQLQKMEKTKEDIQNKLDNEGYKMLTQEDDIPVLGPDAKISSLSDGVKVVEAPGNGKFIVADSVAPEHFSNMHSEQVIRQQSGADEAFTSRGLPAGGETDIMQAKTKEDDKPVGELYYEKLKEAYKDEPKDSDKAKYLRLLEAQSMLDGGFAFLPYVTEPNAFRTGDNTSYLGEKVEMEAADMRGLVDENALGEQLLELAKKPDIVADNERLLKEAIDQIADKDGLRDKVAEALRSSDYQEALGAISPEAAQARYSTDIRTLEALDPDLAEEVKVELKFGISIDQLNQIFDGDAKDLRPDIIAATSDSVTVMLSTMSSSLFGAKRGADIANYYFGGGKEKGQKAPELTAEEKRTVDNMKSAQPALNEMLQERATAQLKDPKATLPPVSNTDINNAMEKAKIPLNEREGATKVFGTLAKAGVLSSTAGFISLAAGLYKMSDGGLSFGETPAQRLELARNFLSLVGVVGPIATMVTTSFDSLMKSPGLVDALGIGKDLRETVWDKRFPPKVPEAVQGIELPELDFGKKFTSSDFWGEFDTHLAASRPSTEDAINSLPEDQRQQIINNTNLIADTPELKNAPDKLRWVGGALSAIGGMADAAGGVLDIVLGSMGLDRLIKEGGTPEEFAARSLQIGAGAAGAGMGATGIAAAFGVGGAAIASAVFGAVGAGLSFIAAIITGVIGLKKDQKSAEEVRDYFKALEEDGLLEPGWGDKLNYLIHTRYEQHYEFKTDNEQYREWYPEHLTAWDAQPEHFKEFTENVEKDGHIGNDWFKDTESELIIHDKTFDKTFYEENKGHIDTLRDSWEDWQGRDDIISKDDLQKILDGQHDPSKEQREAVEFLLGNQEFFDHLDLMRYDANNSSTDGKISLRDLEKWLAYAQ